MKKNLVTGRTMYVFFTSPDICVLFHYIFLSILLHSTFNDNLYLHLFYLKQLLLQFFLLTARLSNVQQYVYQSVAHRVEVKGYFPGRRNSLAFIVYCLNHTCREYFEY